MVVVSAARAAVCAASSLPSDAKGDGASGDSQMAGSTNDRCPPSRAPCPVATSQGSSAGVVDAIGAWSASIVSYGVSGPVSSSSGTRPKCFESRSMTSE